MPKAFVSGMGVHCWPSAFQSDRDAGPAATTYL